MNLFKKKIIAIYMVAIIVFSTSFGVSQVAYANPFIAVYAVDILLDLCVTAGVTVGLVELADMVLQEIEPDGTMSTAVWNSLIIEIKSIFDSNPPTTSQKNAYMVMQTVLAYLHSGDYAKAEEMYKSTLMYSSAYFDQGLQQDLTVSQLDLSPEQLAMVEWYADYCGYDADRQQYFAITEVWNGYQYVNSTVYVDTYAELYNLTTTNYATGMEEMQQAYLEAQVVSSAQDTTNHTSSVGTASTIDEEIYMIRGIQLNSLGGSYAVVHNNSDNIGVLWSTDIDLNSYGEHSLTPVYKSNSIYNLYGNWMIIKFNYSTGEILEEYSGYTNPTNSNSDSISTSLGSYFINAHISNTSTIVGLNGWYRFYDGFWGWKVVSDGVFYNGNYSEPNKDIFTGLPTSPIKTVIIQPSAYIQDGISNSVAVGDPVDIPIQEDEETGSYVPSENLPVIGETDLTDDNTPIDVQNPTADELLGEQLQELEDINEALDDIEQDIQDEQEMMQNFDGTSIWDALMSKFGIFYQMKSFLESINSLRVANPTPPDLYLDLGTFYAFANEKAGVSSNLNDNERIQAPLFEMFEYELHAEWLGEFSGVSAIELIRLLTMGFTGFFAVKRWYKRFPSTLEA